MSEFVEVSTQDLSGAALDWAVAKAEGVSVVTDPNSPSYRQMVEDAEAINGWYCYSPSADWSQGGPLIEKYGVDLSAPPCIDRNREIGWQARPDDGATHWHSGETALIAAMRCIVASVLGDTVSVPKELLS